LTNGGLHFNDCYRPNKNERRQRHQDPNEIEVGVEYWYGWSMYVPVDNPAQDTFLFFVQSRNRHLQTNQFGCLLKMVNNRFVC
jgi:hypothetical protein